MNNAAHDDIIVNMIAVMITGVICRTYKMRVRDLEDLKNGARASKYCYTFIHLDSHLALVTIIG